MVGVPELSATELVLRLTVAAPLGGVIGIERELRERFAGLRVGICSSPSAPRSSPSCPSTRWKRSSSARE